MFFFEAYLSQFRKLLNESIKMTKGNVMDPSGTRVAIGTVNYDYKNTCSPIKVYQTVQEGSEERFVIYENGGRLGYIDFSSAGKISNPRKEVYVSYITTTTEKKGKGTFLMQIAMELSHLIGLEGKINLNASYGSAVFYHRLGMRTANEAWNGELANGICDKNRSYPMDMPEDERKKWKQKIDAKPILPYTLNDLSQENLSTRLGNTTHLNQPSTSTNALKVKRGLITVALTVVAIAFTALLFSGIGTLLGAGSLFGVFSAGALLSSIGATSSLITILSGVAIGIGTLGSLLNIGYLNYKNNTMSQEMWECQNSEERYRQLLDLKKWMDESYEKSSLSQKVGVWAATENLSEVYSAWSVLCQNLN